MGNQRARNQKLANSSTLASLSNTLVNGGKGTVALSADTFKGDGVEVYGVRVTTMGLVIPLDDWKEAPYISEDNYPELGKLLFSMNQSVRWCLGDWLAYGIDKKWGKTYQKVVQESGYSYASLRNISYVCSNVHLSLRSDKLSFAHHQVIAPLDKEKQAEFLARAEDEGLTVRQLNDLVNPPTDRTKKQNDIQAKRELKKYTADWWWSMTDNGRSYARKWVVDFERMTREWGGYEGDDYDD